MFYEKKIDIVGQKEEALRKLKSDSNLALNIVTSTINQLEDINNKIDVQIEEIKETKEKLQMTENELDTTRLHNTKIIDKFKMLIEL